MKGLKKCGLLSLLLIIFGLSLSVCSGSVSAIQYSVDSIMAQHFYLQDSLAIFLSENVSSLGITPRNTSYLTSTFNSNSNKCVYNNYNNPGYEFVNNQIYWGGSFIPPWDFSDYPEYAFYGNRKCNTMYPFGFSDDNVNIPEYDFGSVPFNKQINVSSMLPYSYMYNTIPFRSIRTVDGIDYESTFDISELLQNTVHPGDSDFTYYTDKITYIRLPLNFDASLESFSPGDNISLSGKINFGSGLTSSEVSDLRISLYGFGFRFSLEGSSGGSISIPCTLSYFEDNSSLVYYCSGNLPSDFSVFRSGMYNFSLIINSVHYNIRTPITSTAQSMTFDSPIFTFFNDPDTWGGSGSISGNGSYPNVAPGVARVDPENADFFTSLSNLFNFSFTNPFAPLFNLFTDQSSCASIPNLASMLHSEETQVCPWFNSSTRAIVTPVLGLASVMLIFGFAVRWLGSSSGNLFEDSRSEELSNQGGQWGHFKKRGK